MITSALAYIFLWMLSTFICHFIAFFEVYNLKGVVLYMTFVTLSLRTPNKYLYFCLRNIVRSSQYVTSNCSSVANAVTNLLEKGSIIIRTGVEPYCSFPLRNEPGRMSIMPGLKRLCRKVLGVDDWRCV